MFQQDEPCTDEEGVFDNEAVGFAQLWQEAQGNDPGGDGQDVADKRAFGVAVADNQAEVGDTFDNTEEVAATVYAKEAVEDVQPGG